MENYGLLQGRNSIDNKIEIKKRMVVGFGDVGSLALKHR